MANCLDQKLAKLAGNAYSVALAKAFFKTSATVYDLQTELSHLLNHLAWTKQILYFQKIKACFQADRPLTAQEVAIPVDQAIPSDMLIFVEDAIDQMLGDLERQFQENTQPNSPSEHSNDIDHKYVDSLQLGEWKAIVRAVIGQLAQRSVELLFVERTVSICLSYVAAMRNSNLSPSDAQFNFNQEDKHLKQALVHETSSSQYKQKAQFLVSELHHIVGKVIDANADRSKKALRHAIKHGYPLPVSAAETVIGALNSFLTKSSIYSAGVSVQVLDAANNQIKSITESEGKARFQIRSFNGSLFICQSDYQASIKMSGPMKEEFDSDFVYEAFVAKMKHLKQHFPKKSETLRAGILYELA